VVVGSETWGKKKGGGTRKQEGKHFVKKFWRDPKNQGNRPTTDEWVSLGADGCGVKKRKEEGKNHFKINRDRREGVSEHIGNRKTSLTQQRA